MEYNTKEDKIYAIAYRYKHGVINATQFRWWTAMLNTPAEEFYAVYNRRQKEKLNRFLLWVCIVMLFIYLMV